MNDVDASGTKSGLRRSLHGYIAPAREELALSQKLASIGTLAAGVAHELNNPLTIILGFTAQLLSRATPGPPPQAEMEKSLDRIQEAALRTKKIVEGFLLFARMKKP